MKLKSILWLIALNLPLLAGSVYSQPTSVSNSTLNSEGVNQWVNIGPEGGTADDIVYDPANPQIAFCIVDHQVFKSNDGGLSWTFALSKLTDDQLLRHLAVGQSNDTLIIYAAGNKLFKSVDRGSTWDQLTISNSITDNNDIIVDPMDPDVVYIAAQNGVFKSLDAGETWADMNNGLTYTNISQLAISPANHNVIYAACGEEPLIYRTTNTDTAWSVVYKGEIDVGNYTGTIAIDPTNADIVYASVWGEDSFLKTTDGGTTWSHISSEGGASCLVVDPIFPNVLYFGRFSGMFYKSYDGGNNWTKLSDGRTSFGDITCIEINDIDNSQLLLGTFGCIFKSIDSGLHWKEAITGLHHLNIQTIVFDYNYPNSIFLGAHGRGFLKSIDHGSTWNTKNRDFLENDYTIFSIAINPHSPNELLCGSNNFLYKSIDGGESWSLSTSGINEAPGGAIGSIVFDPVNANVIYVGIKADFPFPIPEDKKVYKSIDGGSSWTSMSNGITHTDVQALLLNPQNTSILYAGTFGGGIFKITNGAVSWTAVNNGIDDLDILTLAMDPNNPNIIYAGTANGQVYKTTDGSNSWQTINSPDSNHRIQILLINPDNSNQIFCGTDYGFFVSQDAGESWYAFNTNLTNRDIRAIALDPTDSRIVYAGTYGGSVFRTMISPEILIGPSKLSFGEVAVDSSKTLYVSLVNSSPMLNLQVNKLVIEGADSADFSYTGPGSFSLVPMETRGVEVVFSPKSVGGKSAFLEIIHNGASSPDTVKLSGVAVSAVGIDDFSQRHLPQRFTLYPNYPNPFNPTTTIRFDMPKEVRTTIRVYDLLGREVRTLTDRSYGPGTHSVVWDGKDEQGKLLPSGEYFVRMQAGDFVAVRKVLLLK